MREFVEQAIASGFIPERNREYISWLEPPSDATDFDWGEAALDAVEAWQAKETGQDGVGVSYGIDWSARNKAALS